MNSASKSTNSSSVTSGSSSGSRGSRNLSPLGPTTTTTTINKRNLMKQDLQQRIERDTALLGYMTRNDNKRSASVAAKHNAEMTATIGALLPFAKKATEDPTNKDFKKEFRSKANSLAEKTGFNISTLLRKTGAVNQLTHQGADPSVISEASIGSVGGRPFNFTEEGKRRLANEVRDRARHRNAVTKTGDHTRSIFGDMFNAEPPSNSLREIARQELIESSKRNSLHPNKVKNGLLSHNSFRDLEKTLPDPTSGDYSNRRRGEAAKNIGNALSLIVAWKDLNGDYEGGNVSPILPSHHVNVDATALLVGEDGKPEIYVDAETKKKARNESKSIVAQIVHGGAQNGNKKRSVGLIPFTTEDGYLLGTIGIMKDHCFVGKGVEALTVSDFAFYYV
jgi:hypothetical protein